MLTRQCYNSPIMKQLSFGLALSIFALLLTAQQLDIVPTLYLLAAGMGSAVLTLRLIPRVSAFMLRKNIYGLDINKSGSREGEKKIPECIGFGGAVAFIMVGMLTGLVVKYTREGELLTYWAVFVTILGTILLGFADDMLDLPWRYKLIFPFFIALPLLTAHTGPTHVTVIWPFSSLLGPTLQLGLLYLLYVVLLSIYLTNTINIFAGINGLQVGQSIVAACSMLAYFYLKNALQPTQQEYLLSRYLLIVFLGVAMALLKFNAYPASIFIGDTFCYFAGIVLAVAAIWGNIPIVCHWFFLPQLINFLYSVPQLFGIVPCPRHRLATYHAQSDLLHPIKTNMNLLNLTLRIVGPTNEGHLCMKLLVFQVTCSLIPISHLLISETA